MGQNGARIKLRRTRHECSIPADTTQKGNVGPPFHPFELAEPLGRATIWAHAGRAARLCPRKRPLRRRQPTPPARRRPQPPHPHRRRHGSDRSRKRPSTARRCHLQNAWPWTCQTALSTCARKTPSLPCRTGPSGAARRALPASPCRLVREALCLCPCASSAWWMARRRSTCWTGPRPWARRERVAAMASWPRARSSTAPPSSSSTGC